MNPTLIGVLCGMGAALAFSSLSILGKLAPGLGLGAVNLLFWRFGLAALVLLTLTRFTVLKRPLQVRALLLGLLYAAQATLYFLALGHLSAGTTSLILYLSPALVVGLQWMTGQGPDLRQMLALGAVLLGVVVLAGGQTHFNGSSLLGWGLALTSALCYALYLFLGSRLLTDAPPLSATAQITLGTAVGMGLLGLGTGEVHLPNAGLSWMVILAVVLVPTVLALPATLQSTIRLGAARASMLLTLEPVFVLLLAGSVLQETLQIHQVMGGALVLLGALGSAGSQKSSRRVGRPAPDRS